MPRSESGPARYEIYEPEAAIVRRIFDDYVAGGHSIRQIAKRLYADGIPSPKGRDVWASSTLGPMLRNTSYMGKAYWYRHENVPSTRPTGPPTRQVRRPQEEWIEVPVPAIITADTFDAAQRVAAHNSAFSARRASADRWLLRGLVVCGPCGIKCGCSRAPTSRGGHNHYYTCAYRNELKAGGPDRRCRERQIRADELDTFVFDQIRQAMLRPELLTAGEAAVVTRQPVPDDELLAGQVARLQRQLDDTDRERQRLIDIYQAGLVELTELTRRNQELSSRRARLQAQRQQLVADRAELTTNNQLRKRVGDFAKAVAASIDELDFAGRQKLMRIVVEQVRVTGWQVQIRLRIPLDQPPALPSPATSARPRARHAPRSSPSRGHKAGNDGEPAVSSQDRLRSLGAEDPLDLAAPLGPARPGVDHPDPQTGARPQRLGECLINGVTGPHD